MFLSLLKFRKRKGSSWHIYKTIQNLIIKTILFLSSLIFVISKEKFTITCFFGLLILWSINGMWKQKQTPKHISLLSCNNKILIVHVSSMLLHSHTRTTHTYNFLSTPTDPHLCLFPNPALSYTSSWTQRPLIGSSHVMGRIFQDPELALYNIFPLAPLTSIFISLFPFPFVSLADFYSDKCSLHNCRKYFCF